MEKSTKHFSTVFLSRVANWKKKPRINWNFWNEISVLFLRRCAVTRDELRINRSQNTIDTTSNGCNSLNWTQNSKWNENKQRETYWRLNSKRATLCHTHTHFTRRSATIAVQQRRTKNDAHHDNVWAHRLRPDVDLHWFEIPILLIVETKHCGRREQKKLSAPNRMCWRRTQGTRYINNVGAAN